ncbi:MAG: hypothetical protein BWK76_23060 [Desulfobulbaceae bacterium A2]|nr:MAG: hypothetical protein BWK76_23060 [Desulfobulbaceae bacterium A2]
MINTGDVPAALQLLQADTPPTERPIVAILDQNTVRRSSVNLLTEDNAINAEIARHILEQDGYQADWTASGWDALRCLDTYRYDVVLMDVQMPELDGHATTAHQAADHPLFFPRPTTFRQRT